MLIISGFALLLSIVAIIGVLMLMSQQSGLAQMLCQMAKLLERQIELFAAHARLADAPAHPGESPSERGLIEGSQPSHSPVSGVGQV